MSRSPEKIEYRIFMKKIINLIILIALIASNCGTRADKDLSGTSAMAGKSGTGEIIFREYQHDFGKVAEGEKVSYTFIFDNKGSGSLILSSAITTCGCTVSRYDRKPVSPGATGSIEVVFDTSGRRGMQTKTITVKSNASTPVVILKIIAEVISTNK